jgi:general secretion pathway protein J
MKESGFTLIEVMISLALFALISMAGIALVDSIIRVEERTAGRLDRLAQFQRTMLVLSRDLEQISAGSLEQVEGGVRFERQAPSLQAPSRTIGYTFRDGSLVRLTGTDQLLLEGVAGVAWSFFMPGRGWQKMLPPKTPLATEQPSAVAVDIALDEMARPSGTLRRVVELPLAPAPDPVP